VRARVDELHNEVSSLLASTWPDSSLRALQDRLTELSDVLEDLPAEQQRERWMDFRAGVQPIYERLAATLRTFDIHVPSLRPTNYIRNVFHVLIALAVILLIEYVLVTSTLLIAVAAAASILAWSLEATRRFSGRWNKVLMWLFGPVAHPHEAHRVNSSTWYTTAMLVLALFVPHAIGAAALAVLGLGDPAAAVIGRRFGRSELINGRTLEGSAAFVVASTAAVVATLSIWHPDLGQSAIWILALTMSVAGAAAELLVRRVDDNLAIPVVAGLVGVGVIGLLG